MIANEIDSKTIFFSFTGRFCFFSQPFRSGSQKQSNKNLHLTPKKYKIKDPHPRICAWVDYLGKYAVSGNTGYPLRTIITSPPTTSVI